MRRAFVFLLLLTIALKTGAQEFEGLKKINGTNLYLSIKGKGEYLIMLHGGPGLNHGYFKPHLSGLEKKFRVVYYDQRASGKTSIPSPDSISFKFFADDLEAIRKELKVEKLNLLAHSWGAVVATHYALAYPNKINKLIFSNPGMLSREYDREVAELARQRTSKQDSLQRAQIISSGNLDVKKYDWLMHANFRASAYDKLSMSKVNLNIPSNFMQANKALFTGLMKDPNAKADLYDSLKSFKFPVLIIHGEADLVLPSAFERLKKNLPKAEIVIFKQSGHFPFVEETEKYIAVVSAFLKKKK